ncbi:MAG: (2Fe-2S)-binding protein [Flavobacteriales bacterium CG_4_10_14_0_2_um_filter_32_8]|nr:MAG: (2Fe-2S)-binding protein [Flavobacteriales bacterium CG_4_10_14_0_2_um_filter_32_8]
MQITFKINGETISQEIKSSLLLIDLIRDVLRLKGTKPGCLEGECGACSVIVNGSAINSCMYLAINVDGKEVTTIEGLGNGENPLDRVQEKMLEHGAVQCGFCTSGMVMTTKAYSDKCTAEGVTPTREEVKKSLEGNLCRCTGYAKIIDAAEAVYK